MLVGVSLPLLAKATVPLGCSAIRARRMAFCPRLLCKAPPVTPPAAAPPRRVLFEAPPTALDSTACFTFPAFVAILPLFLLVLRPNGVMFTALGIIFAIATCSSSMVECGAVSSQIRAASTPPGLIPSPLLLTS